MYVPLNQYLYDKLATVYGDVTVAAPGEAYMGHVIPTEDGPRQTAENMGEYYRINCPFCNESRHRLWVNHLWGVGPKYNNETNDAFWWSAICYNDDWSCMTNPENIKTLRDRVYRDIGRDQRRKLPIARGEYIDMTLVRAENPGTCIPVHLYPSHLQQPQYLVSRGFTDLQRLGAHFGVSVCTSVPPGKRIDAAINRIVAPIFMNGAQVSWQARRTEHWDEDMYGKDKMKYFFLPGTNRKILLYNFDNAKAFKFVIVTEGVTDVWTIGDCAVATFGKAITAYQTKLIQRTWKTVFLALDADALDQSRAYLRSLEAAGVRCIILDIPPGQDPASMGANNFWDMVYWTCQRHNINLEEMISTNGVLAT